jgi:hypothetical protein
VISLYDYTQSLQYEISPPGTNAYPAMTDDEAVQRLIKAFWELRLYGLDFLQGFTCDTDGNINPQASSVTPNYGTGYGYGSFLIPPGWYQDDGSYDLGTEVVEAIVLFAAYQIAIINAQNLSSLVKSQAGSVSYEVQHSAQVQMTVLASLKSKTNLVLTRLSDLGTTSVMVVDQVMEKLCAEAQYNAIWVR